MSFVQVVCFKHISFAAEKSRNIFLCLSSLPEHKAATACLKANPLRYLYIQRRKRDPEKKIMSSISILHRSCLRLGLLPFSPLRARATTLRLPLPQPRRHLHPPRRSAMSSAASRLSHIAAATGGGGGAAGESSESPPAASAAAQEDDGTSPSLGAIVALCC
jgi:hypothetical protein